MRKRVVVNFIFAFSSALHESVMEEGEEYLAGDIAGEAGKELKDKTYLSDMMFSLCLRHNPKLAEFFVRTVTGEDVEVEQVLTGYEIRNLGHSVILDALAIDRDGNLIDYEMQVGREKDLNKRLRMYESSVSLSFLKKGKGYENLPDIRTIVFLDYDIYGRKKGVYTSYMRDDEGNITDYSCVRYIVNLRYKGDDAVGRMVHDMRCKEPKNMYNLEMMEPMDYYKNTEEGRMEYGSDIERYVNEGMKQGSHKTRKEDIEILLRNNLLTPLQISENFGLSLHEVEKIARNL